MRTRPDEHGDGVLNRRGIWTDKSSFRSWPDGDTLGVGGLKVLTVSVHTVDGGLQEWTEDDEFYERLVALQRSGLAGKRLVHSLITDDWGAPPIGVRIHGTLADGRAVDEQVPYA